MSGSIFSRKSVEEIVDLKVRLWEYRQQAARREMKENKEDVTTAEATSQAPSATQTFKITKMTP